MSEIKEKKVALTVEERNEIVERYYEYALNCLRRHELDVEEYHGDICIHLCGLADKFGFVKCMDSLYHSRIHLRIHQILDNINNSKARLELLLTNQIPEKGYNSDWDNLYSSLALENVLLTLTAREIEVLTKAYICDMTLAEIGREMHLSAPRIQQIHAKALRKLRHPSRLRKLKGLLD